MVWNSSDNYLATVFDFLLLFYKIAARTLNWVNLTQLLNIYHGEQQISANVLPMHLTEAFFSKLNIKSVGLFQVTISEDLLYRNLEVTLGCQMVFFARNTN